jgi:hypothetical protein
VGRPTAARPRPGRDAWSAVRKASSELDGRRSLAPLNFWLFSDHGYAGVLSSGIEVILFSITIPRNEADAGARPSGVRAERRLLLGRIAKVFSDHSYPRALGSGLYGGHKHSRYVASCAVLARVGASAGRHVRLRDRRAKVLWLLRLLIERRAQSVARLVLHEAAVNRRLDTQAGFQGFIQVADGDACHGSLCQH